MFKAKLLAIVAVGVVFSGCATSNKEPKPKDIRQIVHKTKEYKKEDKSQIPKQTLYGIASYYGPKWHGRTTANGEKLNIYDMTAAHKSLPFNTIVKVTDLDTGNFVFVRINDRGPYIKGRIIDLTDQAAKRLGIIQKGIARVKVEVLNS